MAIRLLMGTEVGRGIEVGELGDQAARWVRFSPKPMMPPLQTFMPASRTRSRVSRRSW